MRTFQKMSEILMYTVIILLLDNIPLVSTHNILGNLVLV